MLVLSCPEGRNNLDLANILTSFSPEEQMPFCQCVCSAHLGSLLPFYPQVQTLGLGRALSFKEERSEIPSSFWDCHQQFIEGKGEKKGILQEWKEKIKEGANLKASAKLSE